MIEGPGSPRLLTPQTTADTDSRVIMPQQSVRVPFETYNCCVRTGLDLSWQSGRAADILKTIKSKQGLPGAVSCVYNSLTPEFIRSHSAPKAAAMWPRTTCSVHAAAQSRSDNSGSWLCRRPTSVVKVDIACSRQSGVSAV